MSFESVGNYVVTSPKKLEDTTNPPKPKPHPRRQAGKLKNGEYFLRLKVKHPVRCKECHCELFSGQTFVLDFIPLREVWGGKTHYKKVVCEGCWRGDH